MKKLLEQQVCDLQRVTYWSEVTLENVEIHLLVKHGISVSRMQKSLLCSHVS